MSRRWATIFLVVVLVVSAVSILRIWWVSRSVPEVVEVVEQMPSRAGEEKIEEAVKTREVVLYFPSRSDDLAPEIRTVTDQEELRKQAEVVMRALLEGPESPDLVAPLPAEVRLGGVYLGSLGTVYVDLRSEMARPPATGSRMERLMVGSLVESVLANCPELESVALLWNGVQPASFSGHLDTSKPLKGGVFPIAASP